MSSSGSQLVQLLDRSFLQQPLSLDLQQPLSLEKREKVPEDTGFSSLNLDEENSSAAFLAQEREEEDEEGEDEGIYQVVEIGSPTARYSVEYEQIPFVQAWQDLQEFFPDHSARVVQLVADRISECVKKNGKVFGGMTLLSCCLGVGLGVSMILGACSMGLQASWPDIFDVVRSEVWQLVGEKMQEDSAHLAIDGTIPQNLQAVRRHYRQLMRKKHPDKSHVFSTTAEAQQIVGAHERYHRFWQKGYRPSASCRVKELDTTGASPEE